MNQSQFNTVVKFNDSIGAGRKAKPEIIKLAGKILIYGDKRLAGVGPLLRRNATGLVKVLTYKYAQLLDFKSADDTTSKLEVYKQLRANPPSDNTVNAVIDVIDGVRTKSQASTYYGVNYAAVSSVVTRFKVWEGLADEL